MQSKAMNGAPIFYLVFAWILVDAVMGAGACQGFEAANLPYFDYSSYSGRNLPSFSSCIFQKFLYLKSLDQKYA